jgi:hypothetical protein
MAIKYYKGLTIDNATVLRWKREAWIASNRCKHVYNEFKHYIRLKLQPVAHSIGSKLIVWGYAGDSAELINLHHLQRLNQDQAREIATLKLNLSVLQTKQSIHDDLHTKWREEKEKRVRLEAELAEEKRKH